MNLLLNLKKAALFFGLSAVAAFGLMTSANAAANLGFTDDAQIPSWAEEAIEELMFQGVISGNDDGSFAPARQLNRAEVAKIIVLATGVSCSTPATPTFPDVQPGDWFFDYVECMADYGWIDGYPDGMFRPGVGINRAEFAKMVVNAFDIDQDLSGAPHFGDVSSSDWFYGFVETAYNTGIMQGYTASTFSPASPVTRAETVRVTYDAQLYVYDVVDLGSSDGALMVSLSADTPAGTNIPFNATSVPYLTTNLMAAADSDVEIGRITFTRLGLGDNDDFDNCWVEFDGFKVGGEKSVSSDDTVEMTFNPPVIVPAGQTLVTDLVCSSDYNNSQNTGTNTNSLDDRGIGRRNRFAIIGAEDILSTALSVSGNFPIEGEEMETSDYAVSNLEFEDLGSNTTIEVGDEFAEIGKFRLLNDSQSNKDIEVRAITFENDGDGDLDELLFDTALYVGGDQVSYETIIDGDYITFRLDDGLTGGYILEDGDSRVFSIRSDIVSAENGDYIEFKVDNFEDVVGIEIGTSFGVRVVDENGEDAEDGRATLKRYDIDAGELNISDKSPTSEEYAPGSNEVVFQVIRAVVGQPMEFDGITFNVDNGTTLVDSTATLADTFDNFRLYINDRLIDTEDDFSLVSGGTAGNLTDYAVEFDTNFELTTTSEIRLVGDITNDAQNGDKIKFTVDGDLDFDGAEYISTGDEVPNTELLGQATSNFVKVQQSSLIIRRTDGFSNTDVIVAGENNLNVMEFTLSNNNSGDVNITGITIGAFGNPTISTANCQNYYVALFMGGVIQGDAQNLNSNCTADFNDVNNIVIASNEEIEFTLVVNTEEELAGTTNIPTTTITSPLGALSLSNTINDGSANINPQYACISGVAFASVQVGQTIRIFDTASNAGENGYIYDTEDMSVATPATAFSANTGVGISCPSGTDVAVLVGSVAPTPATPPTLAATGESKGTDTFVFTNDHSTADSMVSLGFDYYGGLCPAGTSVGTPYALTGPLVINVASTTGFTVGDTVTVPGVTAVGGLQITALGAGTMTIDQVGVTPGALSVTDCTLAGDIKTMNGVPTVRFAVLNVEADNDENGTTVEVLEGANDDPLMSSVSETASIAAGSWGEDCDFFTTSGQTVDNHLCGVFFNIIDTGRLTASSLGSSVKSSALVARDSDVEVMTIRFRAAYDDIYIEDLYLENDLYNAAACGLYGGTGGTHYGDLACATDGSDETADFLASAYAEFANRAEFKIYDSNGTLLDTETMNSNGKLHFRLDGNEIVVPRGSSEIVSIRVDLYDIDSDVATAQRLQLSLDTDRPDYGLTAESAATGNDIDVTTYSSTTFWEESIAAVTSSDFVAYRTVPMIEPTVTQNNVSLGLATNDEEIGRFSITADAQSEVAIGRLSFDYSMSGAGVDATAGAAALANEFVIYEVINGVVDTNTVIASGTAGQLLVTANGNSDATSAPVITPAAAPLPAYANNFRLIVNFDHLGSNGLEVDMADERVFSIQATNLVDTNDTTASPGGSDDAGTISYSMVRDNTFGGSYTLPVTMGQTLANPALLPAPNNELHEIVWSDMTEPLRDATTADWHNGYLLDVDTDTVTRVAN